MNHVCHLVLCIDFRRSQRYWGLNALCCLYRIKILYMHSKTFDPPSLSLNHCSFLLNASNLSRYRYSVINWLCMYTILIEVLNKKGAAVEALLQRRCCAGSTSKHKDRILTRNLNAMGLLQNPRLANSARGKISILYWQQRRSPQDCSRAILYFNSMKASGQVWLQRKCWWLQGKTWWLRGKTWWL